MLALRFRFRFARVRHRPRGFTPAQLLELGPLPAPPHRRLLQLPRVRAVRRRRALRGNRVALRAIRIGAVADLIRRVEVAPDDHFSHCSFSFLVLLV